MKDLTEQDVLRTAELLIDSNGTTTTLEVKQHLRKEGYYATQGGVSDLMRELFEDGKLASTNDPSLKYQTYDKVKSIAQPTVKLSASKHILEALKIPYTTITRRELIRAGYTGPQADSGIQVLLKNGKIRRVSKGEYTLA